MVAIVVALGVATRSSCDAQDSSRRTELMHSELLMEARANIKRELLFTHAARVAGAGKKVNARFQFVIRDVEGKIVSKFGDDLNQYFDAAADFAGEIALMKLVVPEQMVLPLERLSSKQAHICKRADPLKISMSAVPLADLRQQEGEFFKQLNAFIELSRKYAGPESF